MLVLACFISLAKWLVSHFSIGLFLVPQILVVVPFVVLGIVSAWAILGTKYPKLGIVAVLLIAALLACGYQAVFGGGGLDYVHDDRSLGPDHITVYHSTRRVSDQAAAEKRTRPWRRRGAEGTGTWQVTG